MTEAELLAAVVDLAHLLKWRTMHQRPGLTQSGHWRTAISGDGVGWPDLVCVRDRVVFAELKSDRGRTTVDQQDWAHALRHAGAEYHLWTPREWVSGEIEAALRRHAIGSSMVRVNGQAANRV